MRGGMRRSAGLGFVLASALVVAAGFAPSAQAAATVSAEIVPGKVLYELNGVPEQLAREAFTLAAAKLPLKCTFVERRIGA